MDGKKRFTIHMNSDTIVKTMQKSIVIKPGPGVDPAKGPGPGFHGSTRVNPD